MLTEKEKFSLTISELVYIDTDKLTQKQQDINENAKELLAKHIETENYDLNEEEINILTEALNQIKGE